MVNYVNNRKLLQQSIPPAMEITGLHMQDNNVWAIPYETNTVLQTPFSDILEIVTKSHCYSSNVNSLCINVSIYHNLPNGMEFMDTYHSFNLQRDVQYHQ